jgi:hypothetical protein
MAGIYGICHQDIEGRLIDAVAGLTALHHFDCQGEGSFAGDVTSLNIDPWRPSAVPRLVTRRYKNALNLDACGSYLSLRS